MSHYEYTNRNLLEEPNKYFYTKYHGMSFVEDWKENRNILGELKDNSLSIFDHPELEKLNCLSKNEFKKFYESDEILSGSVVLGSLVKELNSSSDYNELKTALHTLLKRFEVTKKAYDNYGSYLRAGDKNKFHKLINYLLMSEVLIKAYEYSSELPYLNGILKINDTLRSQLDKLNEFEKQYLNKLFHKENQFIDKLYADAGIMI